MADPVFEPATSDEIEMLVAMMRELYAYDGLAFDKAIARRALMGVIDNETFGRVFLIRLGNEASALCILRSREKTLLRRPSTANSALKITTDTL